MKMSERYALKLYNVELEKVNSADTRLHFKYLLTDGFAVTREEKTLDEIADLLNTQYRTIIEQHKELQAKHKEIDELKAQLKEVDKVEFGNKLINLFHSLEGDEPSEYIIMDYGKSQRVKEDVVPLLQDLIHCFNCMFESSEYQYKNNLIMLKYYLKGFKEVCKE